MVSVNTLHPLTKEEMDSLKKGDKLVLIREVDEGMWGDVWPNGSVITYHGKMDRFGIYCEEFDNGNGCIDPRVLALMKPVDDAPDCLNDGARIVYQNGEERIVIANTAFFILPNGDLHPTLYNVSEEGFVENTILGYSIIEIYDRPENVKDYFDITKKGNLLWSNEVSKKRKRIKELKEQMEALQKELDSVKESP